MDRIYPERWLGWSDYARHGGGLFDSPAAFVKIVQACWEDYCHQADPARHIPLTPIPTLSLVFSTQALEESRWATCFSTLEEHFLPELNGLRLPLRLDVANDAEASRLAEPRRFFFRLASARSQRLQCWLLLGDQRLAGIGLGEIQWGGEIRQFAVKRGLLGRTLGSDIARAVESSPLAKELPQAMREDLLYLGWRLRFRIWGGEEEILLEDLLSTGDLTGGSLALQEGMRCPLGRAFTLYQGYDGAGQESADLRLRMLLLPQELLPETPRIDALFLYLHQQGEGTGLLEVIANVHSAGMANSTLSLRLQGLAPFPLSLQQQLHEQEARYHALLPAPPSLRVGDLLSYQAMGEDRYGLSFARRQQESRIQGTYRARYLGSTVIQREQLEKTWELCFALEGTQAHPFPDVDLVELTLRIRPLLPEGKNAPTLAIPLAHCKQEQLFFRYLPHAIQLTYPLASLREAEGLALWIEQSQEEETPSTWRLCLDQNTEASPLLRLRIVRFGASQHLVQSGMNVTLPRDTALQLEDHLLQILPGQAELTNETEIPSAWDIVLREGAAGCPRVVLSHQGGQWMQIQPFGEEEAAAPMAAKALWLSCSPDNQVIADPKERNPTGGPCFAMGLGWGQTQEMAQIRPTASGFSLYRHRPHIPVWTAQGELDAEPYEGAQGTPLYTQGVPPQGWFIVGQAILSYLCEEKNGVLQATISHHGYLHKRPLHEESLAIALGDPAKLRPLDKMPQIVLPSPKRHALLQLQMPASLRTASTTPARYLLQEHQRDALPQMLRWGQPYFHQKLSFSAWRLQQPLASGASLLLRLDAMQGRKHFTLSRRMGRLGHWSEGSAFLQRQGAAMPLFAPDTPRRLPDGREIPTQSLIVGNDPLRADLVLPRFYALPPFCFGLSLSSTGGWQITPYAEDTAGIALQHLDQGFLRLSEEPWTSPLLWEPERTEGTRLFWRCGRYLFCLSQDREDKESFPQADAMLSLVGIFCEEAARLTVGGSPRDATLPLVGISGAQDQRKPIFSLEASGIQLSYEGDALLGLCEPQSLTTPLASFQATLERIPLPPASSALMPWRVLASLLPKAPEAAPLATPYPDTTVELTLSEEAPPLLAQDPQSCRLTLHHGAQLQLDAYALRYERREASDGLPPTQLIPAQLRFDPPPSLRFDLSQEGFKRPDGEAVRQILLGRRDPQRPEESRYAVEMNDLTLTQRFLQDGLPTAKILLNGYCPRLALRLLYEEGKTLLDIPAPPKGGSYHIVLNGKPCHQAQRIALSGSTQLHINHLIGLQIDSHPTHTQIALTRLLLEDPAPHDALRFRHENKRHTLYLQSLQRQDLALSITTLPPRFQRLYWPLDAPLSSASQPISQIPLSHLPPPLSSAHPSLHESEKITHLSSPEEERRYAPCSGTLLLPQGEEIALIDLNAWQSPLALLPQNHTARPASP